MRHKLLAFASLVILAGLGSRVASADDPKPTRVITKLGKHKLFDGKLVLKVYEENEKLMLDIEQDETGLFVGSGLPRKKGAFWLVYAETVNKVWYFQDPVFMLAEVEDEKKKVSFTTISAQDALKTAPKAVLDALPKEVLEKLKGK
jgi:hypothetical protein